VRIAGRGHRVRRAVFRCSIWRHRHLLCHLIAVADGWRPIWLMGRRGGDGNLVAATDGGDVACSATPSTMPCS
jgi:hypothetical protein